MMTRVAIGTVFAMLGLLLWGDGTYALYRSLDTDHQKASRNAKITESCRSAASAVGKVKVREDGGVEVDLGEFGDARTVLGDMDGLIAMCPFQRPTYQCVGTNCEAKPSASPKAILRFGPPQT